jgi:hypothetical protein
VKTIPNHEYVVALRPLFDYQAENWARGTESIDPGELFPEYIHKSNAEIEKHLIYQPAKDFPERKWVMLWEAWQYSKDYERRSTYCCPDQLGMYIYNDFEGYGQIELVENMVRHGLV